MGRIKQNMTNIKHLSRMEKELLLLRKKGYMGICELAKMCSVSEMTMRRDLRYLEKEKKITIAYGGAIFNNFENNQGTYLLNKEKDKNIGKKLAIAKAAFKLIQPNDVILFDSGSTIEALAQQFTDDNSWTFLCYSLNIFQTILPLHTSKIVFNGGIFYRDSLIFGGHESTTILKRYRVSKFFFGAGGIHMNLQVTCTNEEAVIIKRDMFTSSLEKVLLIDSSKFNRVVSFFLTDIKDIDLIITDDGIPKEYIECIQNSGTNLLIAPTT
jgi:DeoR family deoxyribose operon repressor